MTWKQKIVRWTIKGVVWAAVYIAAAVNLGFTPNWQLLALVVICSVTHNVLDTMLPTAPR